MTQGVVDVNLCRYVGDVSCAVFFHFFVYAEEHMYMGRQMLSSYVWLDCENRCTIVG